ncbi:hypothetical protein LEMLEM_LOCUS15112 [Lemmus lemmus]
MRWHLNAECGKPHPFKRLASQFLAMQDGTKLMRDFPLYAMNMFYYYWLIKKLFGPMAWPNIARLEEIYRESRQSQ